jgi:hypothetical protein
MQQKRSFKRRDNAGFRVLERGTLIRRVASTRDRVSQRAALRRQQQSAVVQLPRKSLGRESFMDNASECSSDDDDGSRSAGLL